MGGDSVMHIVEEKLIALVLEELSLEEESAVRQHLDGCTACLSVKETYANLLGHLRDRESGEVACRSEELPARLRELIDARINYDFVRLPALGDLLVASSERGLCYVAFVEESEDRALARLAQTFPGRPIVHSPERLGTVASSLLRYSSGEQLHFDHPLDLSAVRSPFQKQVLRETARIPYGRVATYGELARRVGRPSAARAVGGALNRNPVCIIIPCHRVVARDGSLRGYRWGLDRKERLLRLENASLP
jgi:O-6-methylguanine DNA methyltransferase